MCLSSQICNFQKETDKHFGIGWKVFQKIENELFATDQGKNLCNPYKIGVWLQADVPSWGDKLEDEDLKSYPSGFHIFTTEMAAKRYINRPHYVVRMVRYRGVEVLGYQETLTGPKKCIVAKEMYIEKE